MEQAHLQRARAQEPADLRIGQRADVAQSGLLERLLAFALDHPPVAHKDQVLDPELLLHDADLFHHGGGIAGVAGEDAHRQR